MNMNYFNLEMHLNRCSLLQTECILIIYCVGCATPVAAAESFYYISLPHSTHRMKLLTLFCKRYSAALSVYDSGIHKKGDNKH